MSDVKVKGLAQLQKFLDELPAKSEANILRAALRVGANVVKDEIKATAPFKTGRLRAGVKVSTRIRKGVVIASIKVRGEHGYIAPWLEYGTSAHYISVQDNEKAINRKTGKVVSMTTVNRNVLRIGGAFVGPTVHHPGSRPHPFMRPSLDSRAQDALLAIGEAIKVRLTKQGLNAAGVELETE